MKVLSPSGMYTPRQRALSAVLLVAILLTLVLVFVPPSFAGENVEVCDWWKVGCCYWILKEKNNGHCVYYYCDTSGCIQTGECWYYDVCRVWWC